MLRQAVSLWNSQRQQKGTTLQRRLILFFVSVTAFLILSFTLLLLLFGINGREEKALETYIGGELERIAQAAGDDFGRLSVDGINLSEDLAACGDAFFRENGISAGELAQHPELLTPLLASQVQTLLNVVDNRACGGAFLLLDATINPEAEHADTARSGLFIKKTQPTSTQAVGVKTYYLRGPAQIARDQGIELIGQWKMEYDITDEAFFTDTMETARSHPELPLSRLYYWTGRVTLKDNSESGFLLCVPLRAEDGTVFGLCGIEVSDRLFKSLYSPGAGAYERVFTVAAPADAQGLESKRGMLAGNSYLTGSRMEADLRFSERKVGFDRFAAAQERYGGLRAALRLYSLDSPYAEETWEIAVLMPEEALEAAAQGNSVYLIPIVALLLLLSLAASILISRRYLRPVTAALDSIRSRSYDEAGSPTYVEISDLFDFLAQKDRESEEALRLLDQEKQDARDEYRRAQAEIARLAYSRRQEVDPDCYRLFLDNLHTLTPTERKVFDLYLAGKGAKEILDILQIKENTLKFHNKSIYAKLGVSSRKQLLRYAALMGRPEGAPAPQ